LRQIAVIQTKEAAMFDILYGGLGLGLLALLALYAALLRRA
jgi:hypothetical protein